MKLLMQGMTVFFKGCLEYKWYWKLWLALLLLFNGVLPLFFLDYPIATVVLFSAFSGAIIGFALCYKFGFSKILGLMHGPWVPMVVLQMMTLKHVHLDNNYAYWLTGSLVVSCISIIIDTVDVYGYLKDA